MIDRAETKHIPQGFTEDKEIPGPSMERGYICPTVPNGEILVCGSCQKRAVMGHDIVHTKDCPWAAQERAKQK